MMLSEAEWAALELSIVVGGLGAMLSLPPGVVLGWVLARRDFPGKAVVDAITHAPLVLPPVVTGFLALQLLGRNGPLGRLLESWFDVRLPFTMGGAVLISVVIGFPLLVRSVRLSVSLIDQRLERSAATLGASPLRVFLTVTLPLALPGILAGSMLSFARSLGEFGATITFAGNIPGETQTLPLAIASLMQVPGGDGAAMRLALASVVLCVGAVGLSELLARRVAVQLGVAGDA